MRQPALLLTIAALVVLAPFSAVAQAPAKRPAARAQLGADTLAAWNASAKKLIEMAEDFPEAKYNYRPTGDVRTFKQILLHIGGVNYEFTEAIKKNGMGETDPAVEKFKTKKDVVAYLTKSFADGAALLKEKGEAGQMQMVKHPFGDNQVTQHNVWMMALEHCAEHYGNLVVYYRLNKMVPPASRPNR